MPILLELIKMNKLFKNIDLEFLTKLIFGIFIFSIPTNLFKIFFEQTSFVNGLRVDYLIPRLNLNDILLFLLLILFFVGKNKKNNLKILKEFWENLKNKNILVPLFFVLMIFQFTTNHPIVGLSTIIRVFALGVTAILINKNNKILESQITYTSIKITIIFQSLLAWFQFLNQKSLLGYFFFGETNINNFAGIAKSNLLGVEKILPYGTTAHPNILGGILAVFSIIQLNYLLNDKKYKKVEFFILFLGIFTVILTQSISAILALIFGILAVYLKSKLKIDLKKISLFFLLLNLVTIISLALLDQQKSSSIYRRAYLNTAAVNMVSENIFTGVGLGNFTANVEKYSNDVEVVRFVQPVHNILLLFISEVGLIGITIIMALLIPIFRKTKKIPYSEYLIAITPIAVFDHYLLTIQAGLLLMFLVIILSNYRVD